MQISNELLLSLSRFTNKARKSIGTINVDVLARNKAYQDIVFALVDESTDTELIKLAEDLKSNLQIAEA